MKNHSTGSISIVTLLLVMVVMLASLGAIAFSHESMARSKSDLRASTAYNTAQAVLEFGLTNAFADLQASKGVFQIRSDNASESVANIAPNCTSAVATVTPVGDGSNAWITASATVDGRPASVRAYVKSKDVGIWNNVIFAGSGASGQAINGNVDVRGSVHILGDGEPFVDLNGNAQRDPAEPYTDVNKNGKWDPGEPFTDVDGNGTWTPAEPYNDVNNSGTYDPPMTQTDLDATLSGNSGVYNNYYGINASLLALVPAPPTLNGVETLGAEVRVKNGMIGLSGSASLGVSGVVNGGASKATIDGSYVTGGYAGTKGASAVFSDNGTSHAYDLGALGITFPLITGIGAQPYMDAGGTPWTTQKDYLEARSLTVPVTTVVSTTAAFTYGPDAYGNSMSFTPAGKKGNPPCKLTINGIVKVPDGFQLGSKDSIYFDGNGTLYSAGTIKIDGDFLPTSGKIFPTTARVGLIAQKDLMLATGNGSAQLNLAGAYYAQGTIKSAKQNQVLGTFVASYFDLGTNVPSIYQVPTLPKNMPPAMPGDKAYITLSMVSWRQRKV